MCYVADALISIRYKRNKSNFGREKQENSFNCFDIFHTKEVEVRDTFQWWWERDIIPHFLKVKVLLPIYQNEKKYLNFTNILNGTKMVLKT